MDYVFKLLFGDPANADLLTHLLNAVLQHKISIVKVTILNPMLGKDFDEDKDSFLDILAEDETGRKFNVEIQTTIPFDLGREQGINIGLKQGLIGQVRVLEKALNKTQTEPAILAAHEVPKLQDIAAQLEAELDQQWPK